MIDPQTDEIAETRHEATSSNPPHPLPPGGESITLVVRYPAAGRRFRMVAEGNIANLRGGKIKRYLVGPTGVPAAAQRLVFDTREIGDDDTCGMLGLTSGDTITLLLCSQPQSGSSDDARPTPSRNLEEAGKADSFVASKAVVEDAGMLSGAQLQVSPRAEQPVSQQSQDARAVYFAFPTPFVDVNSALHSLEDSKRHRVGADDGADGMSITATNDETSLPCSAPHVVTTAFGHVIIPAEGSDVAVTKPHERIVQLQLANAMLRAEVEDLHAKLREVECFKEGVLATIKALKLEVSSMSEEFLLGYPQ